jgi:HK97 family phage major capsid protein
MNQQHVEVLDKLKSARSERDELFQKFDGEREKALKAGIDLTEDEETGKKLDALFKPYEEQVERVKTLESRYARVAAWDAGSGESAEFGEIETGAETRQEQIKSLGTQFADYAKSYKESKGSGSWLQMPEVELKTLLSEDAGSGGDLIQPDVQAGITQILFQPPKVADLLAQGTTTSNLVRYLTETTATNAADAVLEGGLKQESTLVFDAVDEAVQKIATWIPVTDEMLEDYGQIRSYIDNRLRLFVQLKEDTELLLGTGTAPHVKGILKRTGVQHEPKSSDTVPDAIHKAITKVRTQHIEPDGIVVHPTDWESMVLAKDAVGGQYFGGGPFTGAYGQAGNGVAPQRFWGLNVVITSSITQGTALVGAFRTAAQIFRRSGITVDISNSHDTFFIYNKQAIRAEERLALAVYRGAAFCDVNGL